jgi:hypothetical protein
VRVTRVRLAVLVAVAGALAATNRWMSWNAGSLLVSARDEMIYRRMALAAPNLPSGPIGNQHAQLFAPNWLVGLLHHVTGVGIDVVFRMASVALMLGICGLLWAALARAQLSTPAFAACLTLFVLNTYSLRYYLIAPGYVTDLGFVLCLAAIALGLISARFWLVLAGILLAVLARQSALPVTVVLAAWLAWGSPWRAAPRRMRTLRSVAVLLLPWVLFGAVLAVCAPFSVSRTPGISGLTLLGAIEHLPSGAGAFAEHFARVLNPMFGVAALLAVALLVRRRLRRGSGDPRLPPLSDGFWACLVLGLSVWLQAVALNPNYSGHPERLAVLGLAPLVVALAFVLGDLERAGAAIPGGHAAVVAVLLGVGSLQYLYTWFGPSTATQGGLLQLVTALGAGAVLWHGLWSAPPGITGDGGDWGSRSPVAGAAQDA